QALMLFNRTHPLAAQGVLHNPPALQVGQAVFIPPLSILEKRHSAAIPELTPVQVQFPPATTERRGNSSPPATTPPPAPAAPPTGTGRTADARPEIPGAWRCRTHVGHCPTDPRQRRALARDLRAQPRLPPGNAAATEYRPGSAA